MRGLEPLLLIVLLSAPPCLAQAPAGADPGPVPADTAILEIQAPAGSETFINGQSYGSKRRFEFRPLKEGQYASYTVGARLAGGTRTPDRAVNLRGGWLVQLPIEPADRIRPEPVLQSGHTSGITGACWSPDGRRIATAAEDRTAIVWDAATGRQILTLASHVDGLNSIRWSPDGRRIATAAMNQGIIWDAGTGRPIQHLVAGGFPFGSICWSPDGKRLAAAGAEHVFVWDAETGQPLLTADVPFTFARRPVGWSPDGRRLVTSAKGPAAVLLDAETGQQVLTLEGHTDSIRAVSWSPDGGRVVTAAEDHTAIVWDATTGRPIHRLSGHTKGVLSVSWSGDGRRIATASEDETGIVWDADTGQRHTTLAGHGWLVSTVSWSSDGRRLVTAAGLTALVWDAETGRRLTALKGRSPSSGMACWSPDGRRIATAAGRIAIIRDADSGQKLVALKGHTDFIQVILWSPDGRRIACVGRAETSVWDVASGEKVQTLAGSFSAQGVHVAGWSPDGRRIATATDAGTVIVWDVEGGRPLVTYRDHIHEGVAPPDLLSVSWSADGRRLVSSSQFKEIHVWDASSGQTLFKLPNPTAEVDGVAIWSPDGRHIATGGEHPKAVVSLHDAASGRRLVDLEGHDGSIRAVSWSPDGRCVAAASRNGSAHVWETTGRLQVALEGHSNAVRVVSWSPDGRRLLTGSDDQTIRIWEAATGDELVRFLNLGEEEDWVAVTPEGLFDGSEAGRRVVAYKVGQDVIPVDRFFQDFYRPGLLAEINRGLRAASTAEFARVKPPLVRIVEPRDPNATVQGSLTRITVEVTDQGGGIQGPWLSHNGTRIQPPGQGRSVVREGDQRDVITRTFEVLLVEGDNSIEVQAASGDGSWESEPARISVKYAGKLPEPALHMIVVGAARYAQDAFNLDFADDDARALASLFRRRAPALYGDRVTITELIDDKATGKALRAAIREAAAKARPQDTLLVFLSGHGTMVGQRYYFLPADFRLEAGEAVEAAVRERGVPVDVLAETLTQGAALKRMLIVDSCAAGGAVELFQVASRNPFAFRGEIERLSRNQGVYILAASASSEVAREYRELGHGVLTYTLLAGLRDVPGGPLERISVQPAGNGVADVLEWFSFASSHVPRLTKQLSGVEQTVHQSSKGASFPVLPISDP